MQHKKDSRISLQGTDLALCFGKVKLTSLFGKEQLRGVRYRVSSNNILPSIVLSTNSSFVTKRLCATAQVRLQ